MGGRIGHGHTKVISDGVGGFKTEPHRPWNKHNEKELGN